MRTPLAAAVALALAPMSASATVINFDDVSVVVDTPITSPYQGLNWTSNFVFRNTTSTTYARGAVSGPNVITNPIGGLALIEPNAPLILFDLISLYLTASWNDGLNVAIDGYLNSTIIYSTTATVGTAGPTFVNLGFLGVDMVTFASFGGTDAGLGGSGESFLMDNLVINGVPEPASLAIFGVGLLGLGGRMMFRGRTRSRRWPERKP